MNPPTFLTSSLYVALCGALGSLLRFVVARPWATLTVNVRGRFAMGILASWLARHGTGGESARLLLGVGVLGGFTTFSAFALEFGLLVERGALGTAAGYVALSLTAGFAGLFAGLYMMRTFA